MGGGTASGDEWATSRRLWRGRTAGVWLAPAAVAAGATLFATRYGVGVANGDTAYYIGAARAVLSGHGLALPFVYYSYPAEYGPLTWFPPLYPLLLAALGPWGVDPLVAAHLWAVSLAPVNVLLLGQLARWATGSIRTGLAAQWLLALSPGFNALSPTANSEPLFVLCLLLTLWRFTAYLTSGRGDVRGLALATLLAGILPLTRYAGALALPGLAIGLAVFGEAQWRRRARDVLIFGIAAAGPLALWLLRNSLVAGAPWTQVPGSLAGRLIWRPRLGGWWLGLEAMGDWFVPQTGLAPAGGPAPVPPALLGVVTVAALTALWLMALAQTRRAGLNRRQGLVCLTGLLALTTIGLHFAMYWVVDVLLGTRLLFPSYVLALACVVTAVAAWWGAGVDRGSDGAPARSGGRPWGLLGWAATLRFKMQVMGRWRGFGVALGVLLVGNLAYHGVRALNDVTLLGARHPKSPWSDEVLLAPLQALRAEGRPVFSPSWYEIPLYVGKPVRMMPLRRSTLERSWRTRRTRRSSSGWPRRCRSGTGCWCSCMRTGRHREMAGLMVGMRGRPSQGKRSCCAYCRSSG